MATTRAQEQLERDEEDEQNQIEYGQPSLSDDDMEEEQETEGSSTRPNLAARYVGVQDRDAPDADDTVVDRAGPSLSEVRALGPIEEIEAELFDKVEREVPIGSGAMKQVLVCKFCAEEFPYMMRDLHTHKNVCPKFPGRQNMIREVHSVPADDNPEIAVDVEVVGEVAGGEDTSEDVQGPAAPAINDEDADEEGDGDVDQGADLGHEEGEEQDEEDQDETQMLEDEQLQVLVPDRVELPGGTNESHLTLKVAIPKAAEADASGDVEMGDDSGTEETTKPSEPTGEDTATGRSSPGNASETASTGSAHSARDAYRLSFRMISGADGERAECLQCGRVCSNHGGAMASHYRKCPAQQAAQDRTSTQQQSITPKKKPTKRRISGQDFEALDDEATSQANESDVDSHPGSPPLRRSKRFKADSKADKPSPKPTTEMESLDLDASGAQADAMPHKSKSTELGEFDDPTLLEFDVVARGTRIKCQHCGVDTALDKDAAEKHLGECDPYKAKVGSANARAEKEAGRPTTALAIPPRSQKRAKTADRDATSAMAASSAITRHPERFQPLDIVKMDHDSAVLWIFGSQAAVERMREHYGEKVMVVRSPGARLRPVEAALCNLDVAALLAQVPREASVTAVVPARTRDAHDDGVVPCTPSTALTLYGTGALIALPAPVMAADMFVGRLAREVKCSSLVSREMHKSELFCGRAGLQLDWQYHKTDTFVVCLRGKTLWRLEPNVVKNPPNCFHLTTPPKRESVLRMQAISLGVGSGYSSVPVPAASAFDFSNDSDNDDDMEGGAATSDRHPNPPATAGLNVVVDAGALVYIPAGTWYKIDGLQGQGGDPMWLQFQLERVAVGQLLEDTVHQLVISQLAMREGLHDPLNGDASTPQEHFATRMRDLAHQLLDLSPEEALPAVLFTTNQTAAPARFVEYDLTDPTGFQGGQHIQVYQGSMYRVNPLAVLMSADGLPTQADVVASGTAEPAPTSAVSTPAAPKKALNRKNKRPGGQALSAATQGPPTTSAANGTERTSTANAVYMLYIGCSAVGNQPRLKVQFRCNATQQALVDWIRLRNTSKAFHVSELARVLSHLQDGRADTELLKLVLRFLCTTGYLAEAKVPL